MRIVGAVTGLLRLQSIADENLTHRGRDKDCDFDSLVKQNLERYNVPGLAVAIVDGEETIAKGYGFAELPHVPVTPQTIFYGASTTKAFVAAGLSLLVDDDDSYPQVKWTTPISELIRDEFVLMDEYSTLHATIEDAATHRTGLPRHDFSPRGVNETVQEVVRSLRYLPLTKPIRTTFQYCNLMYATLGYVIETLTGQWLGSFLASRIWEPLNMTSTYFSLADTMDSGKPFAKGYYWLNESKSFLEMEYINRSVVEGAGGIFSTVLDYSKWVRMMINRDGPISKAGHESLVTPHMVIGKRRDSGNPQTYGYGWMVEQYRGYTIIWHNGSEPGFGSIILYIPELRWGCIMMANSEMTSNIIQEILTWFLVDELIETPMSERINRTLWYDNLIAEQLKFRNASFAREVLYPQDKVANISTSLSLKRYAGAYSNPGYGMWYIQYQNGSLWNQVDRGPANKYNGMLEHISGDHFLIVSHNNDSPDDLIYIKAEFQVSVWGEVKTLGLGLEGKMGDEKIWFERMH